ncbi:MAG: lytic transglycosylase domain-containing protein [Pseudomonadales bacterium]|nr:lytic transglycosylase domain-containing protein [Pseudomonadales bacterium]MCP5186087.1 lytic transglycosylase domain-containing protein [Pseudomonadales bacterium]
MRPVFATPFSLTRGLFASLCLCSLPLASLAGTATLRAADSTADGTVFSDGSHVPTRRVFTYRQNDGVPVFTDKVPVNQPYEVMEFSCYACNPASTVDWHATPLFADRYRDAIDAAAERNGVDAALVRAVIHAESGFNPMARSRKGATGLMQLMPDTARMLGVANATDAQQNIDGGVKYLADLLRQYNGDITLATAAYNAGPSSVDRYGGVPPFDETRTYIRRVKILMERYKALV